MLLIRNLLIVYLIGSCIAYFLLKWQISKNDKMRENTPFGESVKQISLVAALMSWFIVLIIVGMKLHIMLLKLWVKLVGKNKDK